MKKFLIPGLGFLATFFLLLAPVGAEEAALKNIIEGLQKNYKTMKDYKAGFVQETRIKAYPKAQISSGEVFYKKPGKMRWNYDSPELQEVVTDGKTVWIYTHSLDQVMKSDYSLTGQSKIAQAFLSGMGNLQEDFNITAQGADGGEKGHRLLLVPKDAKEAIKSLFLTVDKKNFQVIRSEMTDIYDNVTIVSFSDFKINGGLSNDLFEFKVPEGVEVVTPPSM